MLRVNLGQKNMISDSLKKKKKKKKKKKDEAKTWHVKYTRLDIEQNIL